MILTIGKFEGLHLGHQALLAEVTKLSKELKMPAAMMVFDPHPQVFFSNEIRPLLFTNNERAKILAGLGIDVVQSMRNGLDGVTSENAKRAFSGAFVTRGRTDFELFHYRVITIPFDEHLANMHASDFCTKIFCELGAKMVIVGENYRFGKNRKGDVTLLQDESKKYGASVRTVSPVTVVNDVCDSTSPTKISTFDIRQLVTAGEVQACAKLLGFRYHITGVTQKGRQLGRSIGFPTLNIYPAVDKLLPPHGVYATTVEIVGDTAVEMHKGITNVGVRPTVDDNATVSVETNLLLMENSIFPANFYGKEITVHFDKFVRFEQRFDSIDELKAQIALDVESCANVKP